MPRISVAPHTQETLTAIKDRLDAASARVDHALASMKLRQIEVLQVKQQKTFDEGMPAVEAWVDALIAALREKLAELGAYGKSHEIEVPDKPNGGTSRKRK